MNIYATYNIWMVQASQYRYLCMQLSEVVGGHAVHVHDLDRHLVAGQSELG